MIESSYLAKTRLIRTHLISKYFIRIPHYLTHTHIIMENLYEILQSDPGATTEDLRKAYTKLVRLHHPDKIPSDDIQQQSAESVIRSTSHHSNSASNANEKFIQIDKAWKILSDPHLRAQFDAKWQEHCLVQDLPIQEYVPFQDFHYSKDDQVYTYPCRCGSDYLLSEIDSKFHFDIVCCETCSLTVKVLYDESH